MVVVMDFGPCHPYGLRHAHEAGLSPLQTSTTTPLGLFLKASLLASVPWAFFLVIFSSSTLAYNTVLFLPSI